MGASVKVGCPCGREFGSKVRGRSTRCPDCQRKIYIRVTGTIGGAVGRLAISTADVGAAEWPDPPPDDCSAEVMTARELWELSQAHDGQAGLTVEELAAAEGLAADEVRRFIAAEQQRQEALGHNDENPAAARDRKAQQLAAQGGDIREIAGQLGLTVRETWGALERARHRQDG